jgi:hypothetical protein
MISYLAGSNRLLSLLDELFQASSAVRTRSLSSKANGQSREDGALATPIIPDDKVDEGADVHLEVAVAHKVVAGYPLNDAVFRG